MNESMIRERWLGIIEAIELRQSRTLAGLVGHKPRMNDVSPFEDLLETQNKLAAYYYFLRQWDDEIKACDDKRSKQDIALDMRTILQRHVIGQSTNMRLHIAYKKAIQEMLRDLEYVGV
jgi:hypothetical protein